MHPLRNPLLKDVLVYRDRDVEMLLHCTLQAPVLACSLGYFDNTALFRSPLGNPFRKDIFVLRKLSSTERKFQNCHEIIIDGTWEGKKRF